MPDLTNALLEERSNIPIDTLLNLVDGLPIRVEAVIAAKGGANSILNPTDWDAIKIHVCVKAGVPILLTM